MVKNIIIKSSMTRTPSGDFKSNYGDVVRSTVLLECIGFDYLWFTDKRCERLIGKFVPVEKVVTFNDDFDIRNLSSNLEIYNIDNYLYKREMADILKGNWHGYIPDEVGNVSPENELIKSLDSYSRINNCCSWQQALVDGMGFLWKEQDYATPWYEKKDSIDFGLNWHVHQDWKSKHWPNSKWEELEKIIGKIYTVSWQRGLDDINEYIDWLSSCKVVITCDTLGLHLASALRKKIVAIAGPTENREYPYGRLRIVKPANRECMPCYLPICKQGNNCINEISALKVAEIAVEELLLINRFCRN